MLDAENDGDLGLFVARTASRDGIKSPDLLLRDNDAGRFTDAAA